MTNTPRLEGAASFTAELPTSACQYSAGSIRQLEWLDGWTTQQISARAETNATLAAPALV